MAEALSYTIQVAEALAHADARGVVHRDIKPSNVLITPEGRVKLIDMGLARLRNGDPAAADLTHSGVTLGTFDYISPEQARDPRNADIRSDIYSLGCTLFFMLAGQPPFPEGTVLQKLLQHQGDQPPDIRQFRPDLPEELSRVLRKMMAKDPRHRYASSAELATDLLALAEQIGLRPMIPTSRVWLTPPDAIGVVLPAGTCRGWRRWRRCFASCCWSTAFRPRDDESPPPVDVVGKTRREEQAGKGHWRKSRCEQGYVAKKDTSEDGIRNGTKGRCDEGGDADKACAERHARAPSTEVVAAAVSADGRPGNAVAVFDETRSPSSRCRRSTRASRTLRQKTRNEERRRIRNRWPDAPPKRSGVLIVTRERHRRATSFRALARPATSRKTATSIELRFNGPRKEQPMKLSNQQVTVRAGEGYQPIIVFPPDGDQPRSYPRSMFTLTAGRLTMMDVAVELYVPREVPADNWAMFETWGGQTIRLDRCSLTVRNASDQLTTYHQEVAFVRAKPAPDADVAVDSSPAATPLATIELTDCVARGEAVFLCVEDLQPVYLLWENGLLATTEQLLTAGGGQAAPKSDEMLRLELRHVTAAVRGGLCRLSATPANPYQLTVQFACTDNIIMTARGAPLVEQEGTASLEKSRQQFVWKGDRNYYQDVDVFWMVRNMDSRIAPDVMNFDDWKTHWGPSRENQPSREPLAWRRAPNADRPLHAQTPATIRWKIRRSTMRRTVRPVFGRIVCRRFRKSRVESGSSLRSAVRLPRFCLCRLRICERRACGHRPIPARRSY